MFIYNKCKHNIVSTKIVYSIRIPVELRRRMEEMKEINWQQEIGSTIEELVKNKNKERLLAEAKELRKNMKAKASAAGLIREDRDA